MAFIVFLLNAKGHAKERRACGSTVKLRSSAVGPTGFGDHHAHDPERAGKSLLPAARSEADSGCGAGQELRNLLCPANRKLAPGSHPGGYGVRRKQADGLTERYVDLVRSAMGSPG
jgi:hypothetical protein